MELLKLERFDQIDGRKLMDLYGESNRENVAYFYPDCTDMDQGLRQVEENFLNYIRDEFLGQPENAYYILSENGVWISALRLYGLGEHRYYVEALETHPDFRGRGYACRLFSEVFELLKQSGPFTVRDSVSRKNMASLAVHKRCGFRIAQEAAVNELNGEVDEHCYGMEYNWN